MPWYTKKTLKWKIFSVASAEGKQTPKLQQTKETLKQNLPVFSLISHKTLKRAGFILWQFSACFLKRGQDTTLHINIQTSGNTHKATEEAQTTKYKFFPRFSSCFYSQFSVFAQEGGIAPSTLWLMATSATAALHHAQDKNFKFLFFRPPHDALFLQTVQAQNTTCSVCMLHFFISDWLFRGCRDRSSGLQQKTISQAAELPQWIIHLSHECQSGILFFSTR